MLIQALVLVAAIDVDVDLSRLFRRLTPKPAVTSLKCGITTVGYRFQGKPGLRFRYDGDQYEIPAEGFVELIAEPRRTTYEREGRDLPLNVWPLDQFGFRVVPVATRMEVE